jgi:PAS domain S-box-containing protein
MYEPSGTILVVDDNEAERYYVARVLRKAGFEIAEAGSGEEALRRAVDVPDLITLDVRLPDLSGFEVCRRLKGDLATRDIPVLHISASYTTPDAKAEGLDSGADGYLTHPVNPTELVATVRSLLRARQAEVRVRAAAREWTTTFDLIGDAVCLTDAGGRVIRCNAAFARLLQRPFAELIGAPLSALLPEIAGAEAETVPSHMQLADRHYRVSVDSRPADAADAVRAWVFGDVTDQERQQAAIRQSEEEAQVRLAEIEAVYRSAPVGLGVIDTEFRFVRVNERMAEMSGLPVEAHLGRTVREVLPRLAEFFETRLRTLLATGQPVVDLEVRTETPTQPGLERIWVQSWYPLRAPDGRIVGINIAVEEVTEQRRLQEQLLEAQRLESVGRLAGGVAHETNNQMTVVLGCANFALRHPGTPEPIRADIEQIRHAAERTAQITAQLLAFGRRQHLRPEVVVPDAVLERLHPVLARTLGDRSMLALDLGARSEQVRADVGQLEQVLLNLTLNARDAMPAGGTLSIETAPLVVEAALPARGSAEAVLPGRYVVLTVSDDGHGMDARTLKRAFEPFFTTKGPGRGTGLGLSMVHGVVKQSGGYIRAFSTPGQGTRIEIYLPSAGVPEATPADAAPVEQPPVTGRVLLVEGDPLVRAIIARELTDHGYDVTEAPDGQTAFDLARGATTRFDVVITDLAMPRMDGPGLVERLAELEPTPPVLFISGHPDEQSARQIMETGRPFLQKPFSAEELLARVNELLRGVPGGASPQA